MSVWRNFLATIAPFLFKKAVEVVIEVIKGAKVADAVRAEFADTTADEFEATAEALRAALEKTIDELRG